MKYLKLFENKGFIKVNVRRFFSPMKINDENYNYCLEINGNKFYYIDFPFVKDQDNFEIISGDIYKSGIIEVSIDNKTFNNHKSKKQVN
jgi:hypothetical protein